MKTKQAKVSRSPLVALVPSKHSRSKKKKKKKKDNADANTHSAIVMRYTDIRGVTNSARKKSLSAAWVSRKWRDES